MLDALPPAWLERYEKTKKVKPFELLAEYKKVEVKKYWLRRAAGWVIGLALELVVMFVWRKSLTSDEFSSEKIVPLTFMVLVGFFAFWWILRNDKEEFVQLDLGLRLEEIGDDIRTLIKTVGGARWLNDHGIEVAQVRLAKAIVTEEKEVIVICRRIAEQGIYETPSPVNELELPISKRRAAEAEYDRATTLINHFTVLPHDFKTAKRLARQTLEIGESNTAEKQPSA